MGIGILHTVPPEVGLEGSFHQFCLGSLHSAPLLLCKSEISAPSWVLLIPTGTKQATDSITSFCLVLTLLPSNVRRSSVPCFPKWHQWGWTQVKMQLTEACSAPSKQSLLGEGEAPGLHCLPGVEGNSACVSPSTASSTHCCHVWQSSVPCWATSSLRRGGGAVTLSPQCSWDGGKVPLLSDPQWYHPREGGALSLPLATTSCSWKPSIPSSHRDTTELGRSHFRV